MKVTINTLTTEEFLTLYRSVGWEVPSPEQVDKALSNSYASFTAWEEERPVGMMRLLGDGGMSFYLKDFAVLPDCQGMGVGTLLLQAAEEYIRNEVGNWAVSLELISSKEAVGFYKAHGFEERPCDWDGPGMFKMLR